MLKQQCCSNLRLSNPAVFLLTTASSWSIFTHLITVIFTENQNKSINFYTAAIHFNKLLQHIIA